MCPFNASPRVILHATLLFSFAIPISNGCGYSLIMRLWYMNADFETELAQGGVYRRTSRFAGVNRRLAAHLLWLAAPGDRLLLDDPPAEALAAEAARRGIELVAASRAEVQSGFDFTPWGWTPSAIRLGERLRARVDADPLDVVRRVNSKIWSHRLEQELGVALKGAATVESFDELQRVVRGACPQAEDKWVIKAPFGFAARERVLGRGARVEGAQEVWARRRFAEGEMLIFQPWLQVVREYGVVMMIPPACEIEILGISDLQTNGAGTGKGYLLGREVDAGRRAELERVARIVGERLRQEGYTGAAGMDALEHLSGLHPLLEVNARYTMGFVALAVERALMPRTPVFWSIK